MLKYTTIPLLLVKEVYTMGAYFILYWIFFVIVMVFYVKSLKSKNKIYEQLSLFCPHDILALLRAFGLSVIFLD